MSSAEEFEEKHVLVLQCCETPKDCARSLMKNNSVMITNIDSIESKCSLFKSEIFYTFGTLYMHSGIKTETLSQSRAVRSDATKICEYY